MVSEFRGGFVSWVRRIYDLLVELVDDVARGLNGPGVPPEVLEHLRLRAHRDALALVEQNILLRDEIAELEKRASQRAGVTR